MAGRKRGCQIADKLMQNGERLDANKALAEEVESRQEAFPISLVKEVNSHNNSVELWSAYESGVKEGIQLVKEEK